MFYIKVSHNQVTIISHQFISYICASYLDLASAQDNNVCSEYGAVRFNSTIPNAGRVNFCNGSQWGQSDSMAGIFLTTQLCVESWDIGQMVSLYQHSHSGQNIIDMQVLKQYIITLMQIMLL
jgi:hypothetical protein